MMARKARVAAFAVVLLTAAGLVARSLNDRAALSTRGAEHSGCEGACPYGEGGGAPATDVVPGLGELIGDRDFVFVILPGESNESAEGVRSLVDGALAKISTRGVSAAAVTLANDADGYTELAGNFAIESFPSVIAIGRGHRAAAVSDDITDAKLLRAFDVASTRPPCCGPECDVSASSQ
ncbi:MAG: hypothetical protein ACE5JM_02200 [Armatimonadota bacterium]